MERKTAAAVDRVAAVLLAKSAVPLQAVAAWAAVLAIQVPRPFDQAVKIAEVRAKAVAQADPRLDVRNEARQVPLRIEAAPATPLSAVQTAHRRVPPARPKIGAVPVTRVSVDLTARRPVPLGGAKTGADLATRVSAGPTALREVLLKTVVVRADPWVAPIARPVEPVNPVRILDRLADLAVTLVSAGRVPVT